MTSERIERRACGAGSSRISAMVVLPLDPFPALVHQSEQEGLFEHAVFPNKSSPSCADGIRSKSTPHFRTKLRYKAIPQSISKRCSFHFAEGEGGLVTLANTMIWASAKMFFTLQDPLRLMSQTSALHCVTSVARVFFTRECNLRSSASSEDFTLRRSWSDLGLAL